MSYEVQGKVIQVLPIQSGVSKASGKSWASMEFVVEDHDQYPHKYLFKIFGEEKITKADIKVGEEVKVSFDIDSREFKERWYVSLSAWKVDRPSEENNEGAQVEEPQPVVQAEVVEEAQEQPKEGGDDLPF